MQLYGTGEVVRSDTIRMQPSVCPDPPQVSVTVVGLEERRQLEKLTCDLANKRDRCDSNAVAYLPFICLLPFRSIGRGKDKFFQDTLLTGV
jgi:hypothetical protein